ncbi:MAG: hypothetical protein KGM47_00305 [Acidobacteriota bacterium]|nr:hypothetical protein [Acidobacteriota bacterium]
MRGLLVSSSKYLLPSALAAVICLTGSVPLSFGAVKGQSNSAISQTETVLRGTLGVMPGKAPVLEVAGRDYVLQGQSPYLLHVLEDKRLLHQELQLEGSAAAGGAFVVDRIFAVRNGKLYKIQYYCSVCNITYVQPGHCYCCGRETKLQEVPVTPTIP